MFFKEDDEIVELKTISIEEFVKLKREQRKQRQQEFEEQLKVLQDRTDQLKKELGYE